MTSRRSSLGAGIGLLLLTWATGTARAEPEHSPIRSPAVFDRLTVEDGLPQSEVSAIAQDGTGFLWFGTAAAGLARYDGHRIRLFQHDGDDPSSLSSNAISRLIATPDGRLWIGTWGGGLNVYDPSRDELRRFDGGKSDLSSLAIFALHVGPDGALWAGTAQGVLVRVDPETDEATIVAVPSEPVVTAMASDGADGLWLGTFQSGVQRIDLGGHPRTLPSALTAAPAQTVMDLAVEGEDLWIAYDGAGVRRLDSSTGVLHQLAVDADSPSKLVDAHAQTILIDSEGVLWIGTQGGLHERIPGTTKLRRHLAEPSDPYSIPYPWIRDAFQDRSGVLWFATIAGGVGKLSRHKGQFGLSSESTSMFALDDAGHLWTGDHPGELRRYDYARGVITRWSTVPVVAPDGTTSELDLRPYWTSTMLFHDGRLYVGLDGKGLLVFDPRAEVGRLIEVAPDDPGGLQDNRIYALEPGQGGYLWMGTVNAGLARYSPNESRFEYFNGATGYDLPSDRIYAIAAIEGTSAVWVGTDAGLVRFDGKNIEAFTDESKPRFVYSIHLGSDGVLWLGTEEHGLVKLDPKTRKFNDFGRKAGLRSDRVLGVLADDAGRLWLSTDGGGLAVFSASEERVLASYAEPDGVPLTYNQGTFLRGPDGTLYFGGSAGFIAFDPARIAAAPTPPQIELVGIELFGERLDTAVPAWAGPTLDMDYGDSLLSFTFSGFNYAFSDQLRYAYRIHGLYEEWLDLDSPSVTVNLPDGEFVLQVRSRLQNGEWSEHSLSVPVHVAPPFWRTWWAYLVYGVLFGGVIVVYWSYQRQRLDKLRTENRLSAAEKDLELTAAVQQGFLPVDSTFRHGPIELCGFYRAAELCSGDWWYFEHRDSTLILVIGDVTGHGPGAAMVTAAVGSAFRVTTSLPIERRLKVLNEEVLRVARGKYHMTFTAVAIDVNTGEYSLVNAGGLPMVHRAANHRVRLIAQPGSPLGYDSPKFGTAAGMLGRGDMLVLITDGIPEIRTEAGRELGMKTIVAKLRGNRALDATATATLLVQEAEAALGPQSQADDWTLVALAFGDLPAQGP